MIEFIKISATGNDFIVIDNRLQDFSPDPDLVQKICARRTGIGADGLLLLEKSSQNDFSMRYFNSDGSEGELCGNGARAIALFAYLKKISAQRMRFESKSGIHRAEIGSDSVKVQMPQPQNIRWDLFEAEPLGYKSVGYVEIGVPHFVVEVRSIDSVNVLSAGRKLRYSSQFPKGANIDFIEIESNQKIKMRTYERGVEDETLSCGTGATAVSVLNFLKKKVEPPIVVEVPGGELTLDFRPDLNSIHLSGRVQPIYSGKLLMENGEWMNLKQLEENFLTQKK